MFKKHQIYKLDKYNMLTVEVQGKSLIVREISEQWGEECHTFLSRPELMNWAEKRFRLEDFANDEEQYHAIIQALKEV